VLLLCVSAFGQLEIRVPQPRYKQRDRIDVVIANTSTKQVSFCVEYGHSSFRDADHAESTPTPVYVQRKDKRGWGTLLIGPDVGSMRSSATLGAGESQQYPFRLSDAGEMRIMVDYWIGASDRTCQQPKRRKTAKSRVFVIE
jgi:hypothetical protein